MKKIFNSILSCGIALVTLSSGSAFAHDPDETAKSRAARTKQVNKVRHNSVKAARSGENKEKQARSPRVINGETVSMHDRNWQWTVSITANNLHFCGGTFVSPNKSASGDNIIWSTTTTNPVWVLTAAHCIRKNELDLIEQGRLTVRSGNTAIAAMDAQIVEKAFIHEKYNKDGALSNDIALLKLKSDVLITPKPEGEPENKRTSIALAKTSDLSWLYSSYTALNVAGWGITENGAASSVLQRVRMPYVDRATCSNAYSAAAASGAILPGMICAGYSSGGYDSCQGDSGGPLTYVPADSITGPSKNPVLAGVVSWGIGCAEPNLYGVYTSVLAYRGWMDATVKNNM
ncbi:MAG: serine protease [Planctomycetaceae bacterium]|nr:serine protease [Planctomycetaceae bacterium]